MAEDGQAPPARDLLAADLRFLLEETEVPEQVMDALTAVKVAGAWETATRRADEDRRQEAEAKGSRLPKLGKAAH